MKGISIGSTFLLLAALLTSTVLAQPSAVGAPAERFCTVIAIEDLYTDPLSYDGEDICTEGELRPGDETWFIVPTGFWQRFLWKSGVELRPQDLVVDGDPWVVGDRVSARGQLSVDQECYRQAHAPPRIVAIDGEIPPYDFELGARCRDHPSPIRVELDALTLRERLYEPGSCTTVDIDALYDDPRPYFYRPICTEGNIQIETGALNLYPDGPRPDPSGFELSLEIYNTDAALQGLRTFDRVSARGVLLASETCLGEDAVCSGGHIYLYEPQLELVSRIPAREQCSQIPIEELVMDPSVFAYEMICTEGKVVMQDGWFYLVPHGHSGEVDEDAAFELNLLFLDRPNWAILPGDVISLAAFTRSNRMKPYEIEVLDRTPIREACIEATISEVYSNPTAYVDRALCTEGYIRPAAGDEFYYLLMPDETGVPNVPASTQIQVGLVFPELEEPYSGPGASVSVAGVLILWTACQNALSTEELAAAYADDPYCPPVNFPLMMDIYEIEYLE